jgi:hypothetical protein
MDHLYFTGARFYFPMFDAYLTQFFLNQICKQLLRISAHQIPHGPTERFAGRKQVAIQHFCTEVGSAFRNLVKSLLRDDPKLSFGQVSLRLD